MACDHQCVVFPSSVPPKIEDASQEMMINISEPAILVCLITGYPRPSITWEKDGEDFSTDSTRINILDFEVAAIYSGSGSSSSYISDGFTGNSSITDLLR